MWLEALAVKQQRAVATSAAELLRKSMQTGRVASGVAFLQGTLKQVLVERARASSMTTTQSRSTALIVKQELKNIWAPTMSVPKAAAKASEEEKAATRKAMQEELATNRVAKRLGRAYAGVARARAQATEDTPYTGPGRSAYRRSGYHWKRAARYEIAVRLRAAQKRREEAKRPDQKTAERAWKDYRRESEEWTPPAEPRPHKVVSSSSRAKRQKRQAARKFLGKLERSAAATAIEDSDGNCCQSGAPAAPPKRKARKVARSPCQAALLSQLRCSSTPSASTTAASSRSSSTPATTTAVSSRSWSTTSASRATPSTGQPLTARPSAAPWITGSSTSLTSEQPAPLLRASAKHAPFLRPTAKARPGGEKHM